jgi:hypothetical protein
MAYTDLSVVQAEQAGGTLKVEQVRELQHALSLAPYEGHYRVALLLRFEEAHVSAANVVENAGRTIPQVVAPTAREQKACCQPSSHAARCCA